MSGTHREGASLESMSGYGTKNWLARGRMVRLIAVCDGVAKLGYLHDWNS